MRSVLVMRIVSLLVSLQSTLLDLLLAIPSFIQVLYRREYDTCIGSSARGQCFSGSSQQLQLHDYLNRWRAVRNHANSEIQERRLFCIMKYFFVRRPTLPLSPFPSIPSFRLACQDHVQEEAPSHVDAQPSTPNTDTDGSNPPTHTYLLAL